MIDDAMVEAGAKAIERLKCHSECEFEESLQSQTLMNIRRSEARAALEAAMPLVVAGERERAANIAREHETANLAAFKATHDAWEKNHVPYGERVRFGGTCGFRIADAILAGHGEGETG